jgi:hypothetical protein
MSNCNKMFDGNKRTYISEMEYAEYNACLDAQEPIASADGASMVGVLTAFIIGSLVVLASK